MRLSDHYAVPHGAALLYDFVNTLDERNYVADGTRLEGSDALETPASAADWFERHGMVGRVDAAGWRAAIALRDALRSYLILPSLDRGAAASALDAAASVYPLTVATDATSGVTLVPQAGAHTLGAILVQLHALAMAGQLDRLKACADPDCRWIFLDRSKPGSRRWCSSTGCGNRQKTRTYRARRNRGTPAASVDEIG
jgi:predicted RNA-binding Zn ribbon-like protein